MPKIKKQYQSNFTTVDNTVSNDSSLSWKAKGLFQYLWSKPDNWNYTVTEVSKHAKDGIDATSGGVNELEEHGYLKRTQENKKGCFGGTAWTLSEKPIFKKKAKEPKRENPITENPESVKPSTGNPVPEKPITGNPITENPRLLNTELLNTDIPNTKLNNNGVSNNKGPAQPTLAAQRREVIAYLNEKTGKHFKPNADGNKRVVDPRLKEGYTVAELKRVIDTKYSQWHGKVFGNGEPGDNYLRPETLFRPSKLEGYLNESPKTSHKPSRYGHQHIEEPLPDWAKKQNEPKKELSPEFLKRLAGDEEG